MKTDTDGFCACGCGRRTKIVGGRHLEYFSAKHHPKYPNRRPKHHWIFEVAPAPPPPPAVYLKGKRAPVPQTPSPRPTQESVPQAINDHDRIGALVHRMKSDPDFISEQRR